MHIEKLKTAEQIYDVSLLWLKMVEELAPQWNPNVEWWRMIAGNLLQSGIYEICLMMDDDNIVGFLDWVLFPEPATGELHATGQHLYIEKPYRKTSAAGKLCRYAYKSMRIAQAQVIDLMCFNGNENWWGRKGFIPVRTMMRRTMHV